MAFFVHVADESNMERSRTEAESLVSADLGMVPHHNDVTGFVVKLIDVLGILRTNRLN
jgi:prephenate dehydratase